jgi:hypothetical protein
VYRANKRKEYEQQQPQLPNRFLPMEPMLDLGLEAIYPPRFAYELPA